MLRLRGPARAQAHPGRNYRCRDGSTHRRVDITAAQHGRPPATWSGHGCRPVREHGTTPSLVDPIEATETESQIAVKRTTFSWCPFNGTSSTAVLSDHAERGQLFQCRRQKHRLTQQAISKGISRLEQNSEQKLFLRDGHQLKPTAVGKDARQRADDRCREPSIPAASGRAAGQHRR